MQLQEVCPCALHTDPPPSHTRARTRTHTRTHLASAALHVAKKVLGQPLPDSTSVAYTNSRSTLVNNCGHVMLAGLIFQTVAHHSTKGRRVHENAGTLQIPQVLVQCEFLTSGTPRRRTGAWPAPPGSSSAAGLRTPRHSGLCLPTPARTHSISVCMHVCVCVCVCVCLFMSCWAVCTPRHSSQCPPTPTRVHTCVCEREKERERERERERLRD